MITVLYIVGGAVALIITYLIVLKLYERTARVLHSVKLLALDRKWRQSLLDEAKLIYPGADGNFPLLETDGRILDAGRGLLFDKVRGLLAASPEVAKPEQLRRIVQGAGGWPAGESAKLLSPAPVETSWPEMVDLRGLFVNRQPTINDLVVGVAFDENGQRKVISASIHSLMHVLAVGISGYGKSSWLRSLLWQLAKAREPVEIVAIDVSGSEFGALYGWSKLRYPVAKEIGEAVTLLNEVTEEVKRRRELFAVYPTISNLVEYNGLADEPLPPLLTVVDEGTMLLNEPDVGDYLRRGVQSSRQFGCYFVVTGQSAHHRVIPTQTRDQFATRICFKTSQTSSRVVLDDSAASTLPKAGRAYAQLTGRELCQIQGPYVTKEELMRALTNDGPKYPMPENGGSADPELEGKVKALYAEGLGLGAISDAVFGYRNSRKTGEIKSILGL